MKEAQQEYTIQDLEVLISTMNRTSLDFLDKMFQNVKQADYKILIINQTISGQELYSEQTNVRVINSFEKGLTKSRNLAIENAVGFIGVIADDDIVYEENFAEEIIKAHNKYRDAGLISFQVMNFEGKPYKNYDNIEKQITKRRKETPLSSVEITFKINTFLLHHIYFNEFFGLGAKFQAGEEELLLLSLFRNNIKVIHVPRFIINHASESSASNQGTDRFIYARGGLKYVQYGEWSKIWLIKFIFFLLRNNYISFKEIGSKYAVGYSAIQAIKELGINRSNF